MAEQKTKSVTKKISSGKSGSAAAVKPKTTKVAATVAARKTTTKKSAAPTVKKTPAAVAEKKAPAKKTAVKKITPKPTPEERYRMVQTAAYFIAERNGFGGCAIEHWAAAEREITSRLGL